MPCLTLKVSTYSWNYPSASATPPARILRLHLHGLIIGNQISENNRMYYCCRATVAVAVGTNQQPATSWRPYRREVSRLPSFGQTEAARPPCGSRPPPYPVRLLYTTYVPLRKCARYKRRHCSFFPFSRSGKPVGGTYNPHRDIITCVAAAVCGVHKVGKVELFPCNKSHFYEVLEGKGAKSAAVGIPGASLRAKRGRCIASYHSPSAIRARVDPEFCLGSSNNEKVEIK